MTERTDRLGSVGEAFWSVGAGDEAPVLGVTEGPRTTEVGHALKATGMSTASASKVRAGRRVPHPGHWDALGELSQVWEAS